MTKVAVAGTFNRFHKGHRKLLDAAFENGDFVFIGITSDGMASESRSDVRPFNERKKDVESYAGKKNKKFEIGEINDPFVLDRMKDMDALVVSAETEKNGRIIKEKTGGRLKLIVVDLILSDTGEKISSSGIIEGRFDADGKSL